MAALALSRKQRGWGFRRRALLRLVLSEHGTLLALGLSLRVAAAAVAVLLPAILSPGTPLPYAPLALTLAPVLLNGLLNVNCAGPAQTITGASPVCANSTGNTTSVTATSGATYAWSTTGGTITSGGSSTTVIYTAGASGSVTLNCVVTSCGIPSAGGQNFGVTINPLPTVAITPGGSTTICIASSVGLAATGLQPTPGRRGPA